MSTTIKNDLAGLKVLGASKVTIATATTTNFDFGTPNDLDLSALADYAPGDRVLVVLTASTAGTTDALTWVIQDADDNAGSIGTPAAASLAVVEGALAASTGDDFSVFAVKIQNGRPWIRVAVTRVGTTDTHVTHCTVLAVPTDL